MGDESKDSTRAMRHDIQINPPAQNTEGNFQNDECNIQINEVQFQRNEYIIQTSNSPNAQSNEPNVQSNGSNQNNELNVQKEENVENALPQVPLAALHEAALISPYPFSPQAPIQNRLQAPEPGLNRDPSVPNLAEQPKTAYDAFEKEEYYHGYLPAKDAEELLAQPGDFMIRMLDDGGSADSKACLSIRWNDTVKEIPVLQPSPGQFSIAADGPSFSSLAELVDNYSRNPIMPDMITLTSPVLKQPWELRHSQVDLTKKLGEGAFGEVYVGRFSATAKFIITVAVKLLKGGVANKKQIIEMTTEARLMRDFRHPNIVRFYGLAIDHEPILIVMEHVQEGALDSYLRRKKAEIPPNVRVSMCCDAALGVEYLHRIKIMHRDISARNCLYGGFILKLSDFGLSRKGVKYKLAPTEKTPIRWTAPEVFLTCLYTPKADVWAFGILVWEIFVSAEEEPYKGWNTERVRAEVLRGYRLRLPPNTPPKISDVFNWVTTHNAGARPSISPVARQLEKLAGRAPAFKGPNKSPSPSQERSAPVRRAANNQSNSLSPKPLANASSSDGRLKGIRTADIKNEIALALAKIRPKFKKPISKAEGRCAKTKAERDEKKSRKSGH